MSDLYLTSIPDSIWSLNLLTQLSLQSNQLKTIPNLIENLSSLQFLNLSNNQLKTVPNSMINLKNNDFYINLNGNSQELNNILNYQSLSQYLAPKIEVENRIDAFVRLTNHNLNHKYKIPPELKTYIAGFAYDFSLFSTEPTENQLYQYIKYIESEIPNSLEETIKSFLNEVNIISLVDRDSGYLEAQEQVKENSKNLNQNQQIVASSPKFNEYLTHYIAKVYEEKSEELQKNTDKKGLEKESEDEDMPLNSISLNSLYQLDKKPSHKIK